MCPPPCPAQHDSDPGDVPSVLPSSPPRLIPPLTPSSRFRADPPRPLPRQTRSGAEFSPFMFENAVPYRSDRVSLRELLVRRAAQPESDDESLRGSESDSEDSGSDYSDSDAESGPAAPIFTARMHRASAKAVPRTSSAPPATFTRWVTPPAAPAPRPFLATGIRVRRPGAPIDPRGPTFTHWVNPAPPPPPRSFVERVIRVVRPSPSPPSPRAPPRGAPAAVTTRDHRNKPARARVTREQRLKKRSRDRRVRREHREERRVKSGSALKGITQLRVRLATALRLELNVDEYPLPVASSGWMGKRQFEPERREYTLEEARAIDDEFVVYEWDGVPQPVIDRDD
ncbi:hypothetical protein C8F04DRAFT_1253960 [Mycena alexandri]|uniref:Uncharacterized protein n=1 Tax=Mycena alexandri TaxID=1745969 RepID=A0AAD6T6T4_9AGAR|nr:hypothetical protein C8F04DRAFT_1253960 [Mycena alexandri]